MKYVLLFVDTEQFASDLQAMGPVERDQAYEWFAEHAGQLGSGSRLRSPETATTVRLDSGEPVITDGPFVEGKEVVSGYAEIEVADLDEALPVTPPFAGARRALRWIPRLAWRRRATGYDDVDGWASDHGRPTRSLSVVLPLTKLVVGIGGRWWHDPMLAGRMQKKRPHGS